MSLSTRLTLVFGAAALVLLAGFTGAALRWQTAQEARLHQVLLDLQRVGWQKLADGELGRLETRAQTLAEQPWLATALAGETLAPHTRTLRALAGSARLELTALDGMLRYSSATTASKESPLDAVALQRVWSGQMVSALAPVAGEHFALLVAVPLRQGERVVGALSLAMPVRVPLQELARSLGGSIAMFNMRGRALDGDGGASLAQLTAELPLRRDSVIEVQRDARRCQVTSITLAGADGRQVGALALVRDVSLQRAEQHRQLWLMAGATLMLLAAVLLWVFFHVRRSFAPLARAVEVLTALSRGDTSVWLEVETLDEAGYIALGVARLREEMIKLELLREERQREAQRQERILREELRLLEETLDPRTRGALVTPALPDPEAAQPGGQMAFLTLVLRGLSARIRIQQANLLDLVQDLNAALRTRQAFVSIQQELVIARRMQMSILPGQLPLRAEVELDSLILPAKEVGGDFYDYFLLDEHRLGVVIADVSGKGVPAAFYMAVARTLLKVSAGFVDSPAETLRRVNNLLAAENEEMMFVTVFYGVLDLRSGRFHYTCGGHNLPLLRRHGRAALLPAPGGMALAVQPEAEFGEGCIDLLPGDVLFMYTDGVTEANNEEFELFGDAAVLATLDAMAPDAPAHAYPAQVNQTLKAFVGSAAQADDITCMALRYMGSAPAATSVAVQALNLLDAPVTNLL